jgi:general stress protein 26
LGWERLTDLPAIVQACRDVMHVAEAVIATTLDEEGAPCTRAMFNLRRAGQFPGLTHLFATHDQDLLVYLSTNTSSEKVRHIQRDDRVSLYYCVPHTFHGVMLAGRVTMHTDAHLKADLWQPGWEIYFPAGVADPDYTVLSLRPHRVRGWLGHQSFDACLDAAS